MSQRVILTLDVTLEEARQIAERIAGVGPYYEAYNLPTLLDEAEEQAEGTTFLVKIRSNASAAISGPEMPRRVKRASPALLIAAGPSA